MSRLDARALALTCAALVLGGAEDPLVFRAAQALQSEGQPVTVRKVGYPELRVGERSVCGQLQVAKSVLSPDYFNHVVFGGFREGTCAQIGYTKFEESKVIGEGPSLPFFSQHNVTFEVFSRDPTTLDVADCISRECQQEMSALGSSPYIRDAAHCVSPAFGPCAPKAWECLGDAPCRSALECMPNVARTCGKDVWQVMTDPVERKKVTCIWDCNNSKTCVLMKCGKVALSCLVGTDPLCHKAAVCVPKETLKCALPAAKCLFSTDGICRDNLLCLAKGANVCADPAVNLLTDVSIAKVMTCANQRCPAPGGLPNGALLPALQMGPPSHYPTQLACMGFHCAGKVARLLGDKDVGSMATCLVDGLESCNGTLWDCLGDESCKRDVKCWADSVWDESDNLWKMVTDKAERSFDAELYTCVSGCYTVRKNPFSRAFCIAATCGRKALECGIDSVCRGIFTELPEAVVKCGYPSLRNPEFMQAAKCIAQMGETCGRAGIELVRDQTLADIVTCNAKCTRPPQPETQVLV
mmetsp:Transcript_85206/g.268670  ORF Transcript_85206/g.268670 Transcript_85206/m.268670 type:complete len:526 (+) Transcript_85206:71-1648(+)